MREVRAFRFPSDGLFFLRVHASLYYSIYNDLRIIHRYHARLMARIVRRMIPPRRIDQTSRIKD
jgi:hypothetical protein